MRVEFYCSTGFAGCTHREVVDIPDDEIEGMTPVQVDEHLTDYTNHWVANYIDFGFCILRDGESAEDSD